MSLQVYRKEKGRAFLHRKEVEDMTGQGVETASN